MKKFLIINGGHAYMQDFPDTKSATTWAQNYCNHSKEIFVHEIKTLQGAWTL